MKYIITTFFLFIGSLLASQPYRHAKEAPIFINSDEGIECIDEKKTCVASKNVKVTKGPLTLYCDKLTAKLRKNAQGRNEIYFLHAQGNVRFYGLGGDKAFSPEMTYDIDKHLLVLLKNRGQQKNPLVFRNSNVMEAECFSVSLGEKNTLEKIIAHGHTTVDRTLQKMVENNKEKESRIRALIYPDSFKNMKQRHDSGSTNTKPESSRP